MQTVAKPSIKEIAAMPFPDSLKAMRKHYNADWGKPAPEGKLRSYKVAVSYTFSGRDTWETQVNAHSEEEAEELAGKEFDAADLDLPWDAEVDAADFEVEEAGEPRQPTLTRKGGDATQIAAPFMGGAVPKADAQ